MASETPDPNTIGFLLHEPPHDGGSDHEEGNPNVGEATQHANADAMDKAGPSDADALDRATDADGKPPTLCSSSPRVVDFA